MSASWLSIPEGAEATPALFNDRFEALLKGNVFNVRAYGAVGDGTVDDLAAIRSAITSAGTDGIIYLSKGTYNVSGLVDLAYEGQIVVGDGATLVSTSTGAGSTVLRALNLGRNAFFNLNLRPNAVAGGQQEGFGIAIFGSDHCIASGNKVSGHRRGGIMLADSNYCKVVNNSVFSSVVSSGASDTQAESGVDIYITGNSSYNIVTGNHCVDGSGMGIAVQTITSGDRAERNVIEGNTIRNQDLYGIMLYVLNPSNDHVEHNVIRGNTIDTITGNIPEVGGDFNYGAGIYLAAAEHTTIEGNSIRNTNVHTPNLQQAPAAIGITATANAVVASNQIEDAGHWGIACIQTGNAYTAEGRGLIVANNSLRSTADAGIFLNDCASAIVTGNRVHGDSDQQGIYVRQAVQDQSDDFIISGNRIEGFGVGIQSEGTIARLTAADNHIFGNTGYGILGVAHYVNIHDNAIFQGAGGDGIAVTSANSAGFVHHNYIQGGSTGVDIAGSASSEANVYDA